jgi:hypothetical protein
VATKKKRKTKSRKSSGPGSRGGTYRTAGSKYTRKTGMSYSEAARASGAVYPKKFPSWHKKAGRSTGALAGKPLTKGDALMWKRPVVGYINRKMVKGWWHPTEGGAGARRGSKRMKAAIAWYKEWEKAMKASRKVRRSHWKRKPERYKRGPKKGRIKKDYKVTKDDKVKFRKGRGPMSYVKVFRGFSPSTPEISDLVRAGQAGHMFAPGGKVKLNKPRRRKKARRRRPAAKKNPRRRKRRVQAKKNPRHKAKGKKRPTRRKKRRVSMLNNPRRKKRRGKKRRRAKAVRRRKNPVRRKRRKTKAKANPRRRRKARKGRRRRRRSTGMRRYSKNPMGILKGMLKDLKDTPKWITAGHILFGAGANATLCGWALTRTPLARVRFLQERGILGSVARLAMCGLGAGAISAAGALAARALGNPKLLRGARTNLLIGGMAYALANFLYEVAPGTAGMFMIPQVSTPRRGIASASMEGWGPDYKYGYGGMGAVVSPEDLVAGESLARNVNEFSGMGDWMELSGLGVRWWHG